MYLNTLQPAPGSKSVSKCLGRGIGSGLGKTSGRGHKGDHARTGGYHKLGFEGGQTPLQRRLPKFGFKPPSRRVSAVRVLGIVVVNKLTAEVIDLQVLKDARLVSATVKKVKLIVTGELKKAVCVKGLQLSKGARALIEAVGGSIEK